MFSNNTYEVFLMKNFFQKTKDRKVRKHLAIYFSASITAIGLVHLFSLRYHLPTFIFDTLLVFLLFGIINISLLAWFHGEEGKQKVKKREYFYHIIVFGLTIITFYLIANKGPIKILHLNAKTVAVLPFTNMSDSKEDEYFSDGITEDILTQLSKISELRVISRTSVMKYKNSELSIPEIAQELGAGTILEGSVRRAGQKVRITSQLINAGTDEHIWAETFDRKIDDIFEVQSEIAKHIATELEAQLAPKEELLIETKPTNNIDAYAFCLKGREFASKYTDDDNETAIEFYKKALVVDSNYALAYASLASAYDQKVRRYFYKEEWRDSAILMSNKALSLNPKLAEGHSSLAKSYEAKQDYKLAKYHYEKAIRLNPNYYAAIYNLGVVHFNDGKLDKAHQLIKQSVLLEPDNVFGYVVLAGIYQKLACDKLAIKWLNKALELDPDNLLVHIYLIDQYILMNDLESAKKNFDKLIAISPNWAFGLAIGGKLEMLLGNYKNAKMYYDNSLKISGSDGEYDYGFLLMKLDQHKKGRKIIEDEIQLYLEELKENSVAGNMNDKILSDMYSILGNKKESLTWLNKAVNKNWFEYRNNLVYPFLDSIKNEEKFNALIDKMKFKTDSIKASLIFAESDLENCE